ncbi:MAG TPA: CAP domain-containing protein, partial [Thermoleophilaceae bacterium]|nr:CAP domain-containing protein [Thermoleophilaceae bacterium]
MAATVGCARESCARNAFASSSSACTTRSGPTRAWVALAYETRLEAAAQRHAEDMVERQFFAHDTPEGLGPADRALNAGYPTKHYSSGENLAWGTGLEASPVEIVDGWMHSPGHRENILRNAFTQMGVGVVAGVPETPEDPLPGATYAVSFGGPPLPAG